MIRTKRLLLLAALSLSITACTVGSAGPRPADGAVATAGAAVVRAARTFGAAELGYVTTARAAEIAVDAGIVTGARAVRGRTLNADARALLIRGKSIADIAEQARLAARLLDVSAGLRPVETGAWESPAGAALASTGLGLRGLRLAVDLVGFATVVRTNAARAARLMIDGDAAELDAIHGEALAAADRLDARLASAGG
ncbi:MAG: hypothetical protein V4537_16000 [Pseudomonadota bacterium]